MAYPTMWNTIQNGITQYNTVQYSMVQYRDANEIQENMIKYCEQAAKLSFAS